MTIVELQSGGSHEVEISEVSEEDLKGITKSRYFFDWKKEKENELYKLTIKSQNDILGLISFEIIPEELRIHVNLLTVSKENVGSKKKYDNIAANLLTFVAKIAIREFGEFACVSLRPKSKIAEHYIDKYKMNRTGLTLSIEILEIMNLIKTYDDE